MLALLGSRFRQAYRNTFSAASRQGRPNTAKGRLDQPSGVPLKSKWVGTRSGRRLYSTNPAIIGSKQMTVVKINRFFSCFMVVRPFQIL